MTGADQTDAVEALAEARCSSCGDRVRHHERYPFLDGVVCRTRHHGEWCPCSLTRDQALLASDWLAARDRRVAAATLRRFADSLGVNVGDEGDEWWRGYRQGQREALRKASEYADRIEAES